MFSYSGFSSDLINLSPFTNMFHIWCRILTLNLQNTDNQPTCSMWADIFVSFSWVFLVSVVTVKTNIHYGLAKSECN